MKRRVAAVLMALLLCLPFYGCAETAMYTAQLGGPLYSNLEDEETRGWLLARMKAAGLDEKAVDAVGEWIADFNALSSRNAAYTHVKGFVPMNGAVDYGDDSAYGDYNYQWWKAAKRAYWDVLCRSTAFFLLQDQIAVERTLDEGLWNKKWFQTDFDGFETNPGLQCPQETVRRYFTLYQLMDCDGATDARGRAEQVKAQWDKFGVRFREGDASLLTLWTVQEGSKLYPSHAAVLIHLPGEQYVAFEKYGPEYPYQATIFASKEEIRPYFDQWAALGWRGYEPVPEHFVMENDRLLE
ncbi:MAG: DUF4300 family protein [Clostridiales bacterium]|nr:DUF4300 family protein [Clostridiales bacterium]MDO4349151.1 DUF4300 family protein [Eubacteriales bacterium]MDY4007862.1 DUF4300 family protein [Candidatus Limiplasma sp.]